MSRLINCTSKTLQLFPCTLELLKFANHMRTQTFDSSLYSADQVFQSYCKIIVMSFDINALICVVFLLHIVSYTVGWCHFWSLQIHAVLCAFLITPSYRWKLSLLYSHSWQVCNALKMHGSLIVSLRLLLPFPHSCMCNSPLVLANGLPDDKRYIPLFHEIKVLPQDLFECVKPCHFSPILSEPTDPFRL